MRTIKSWETLISSSQDLQTVVTESSRILIISLPGGKKLRTIQITVQTKHQVCPHKFEVSP